MTDQPRIDIKTAFNADRIEVVTEQNDGFGNVHTIARKVIRLEDAAVREALIKLGWTPPGESTN